ncbi:MAG: T9SS type A sorting domain-containing protein [Bacteroidetes bacterium]|nr:T9SS type A sorting domain-containing protein [Bacteroidota bacterium]
MAVKFFPILFFFSLLANIARCQGTASVESHQCLGGGLVEDFSSVIETSDGGLLMVGVTQSNDGNVSGNHGHADLWVVKLSAARTIEWQKCLGGSQDESRGGVIETSDGGFVIAGFTTSNDGDVHGLHGIRNYADAWVVKLSSTGTILWQHCYGGSGVDEAVSIVASPDGGMLFVGVTDSYDGDVSGVHGASDIWVVKLSSSGQLQWQRCYGGVYEEEVGRVITTRDGGYAIVGTTNLLNVDPNDHRSADAIVLKLNSVGDLEWQSILGAQGGDWGLSIAQTNDDGFVMVGYTINSSFDTAAYLGGDDGWVVKLDAAGTMVWQRCYGGKGQDIFRSVIESSDGDLVVLGDTGSSDGDVVPLHTQNTDLWLLKLSPTGDIRARQCFGGASIEYAGQVIQTTDGKFVVGGVTQSYDGVCSDNHGYQDIWLATVAITARQSVGADAVGDGAITTVIPNPVMASTTLSYDLSTFGHVEIDLINAIGQRVKLLSDRDEERGKHSIEIDCRDLPDGVYSAEIRTSTGIETAKFVVLK